MTQTTTTRSLYRSLPGLVITPTGAGNEAESICAPYNVQQFTLAFGGVSPLAAGNYTATFVTPVNGSIVVTVNSDGTKTFAAATDELAATINQTVGIDSLFIASSDGATTVTLYAKSANTDLATPVTSVPGADTLTATETVAPSAPSLRMGLFYVYADPGTPLAITGTPRGSNLASLPGATAVVADLRGVVARAASQTELSPLFNDSTTQDAYPAGNIAPGCNRGEVYAVVDPASATMTPGGEVHVVIAAGAYSVIGAVASAADGGNTLRIDNVPAGNLLARVPTYGNEETLVVGQYSARLIPLKVNRTN